MVRKNYSSGAPLEEKMGYSRMVRLGNQIHIGGTTAVQPDGSVFGENDAYAQAGFIFDKFMRLLIQAGAGTKDVYKIKGYCVDMAKNGADVARAFSERFHDVKPLFTVVGIAGLNRPTQLVEIELEAAAGTQVEA